MSFLHHLENLPMKIIKLRLQTNHTASSEILLMLSTRIPKINLLKMYLRNFQIPSQTKTNWHQAKNVIQTFLKKKQHKKAILLHHLTHLTVSIKLQMHHWMYLASFNQRTIYSVTISPLKMGMHSNKIKARNQLAKSHQTYLRSQEFRIIWQNWMEKMIKMWIFLAILEITGNQMNSYASLQ